MKLRSPLVAGLLLLGLLAAPVRAETEFGPPEVPEGFRIEPVVEGAHHPTRLLFGPDGRLYIAQQTGEILAVTLEDGRERSRQQVATAGDGRYPLGIALREEQLWVSETGAIALYERQADGSYANRREIVSEIPFGLHQNDGLAWGPDGKLYLGVGSTTDRGPEPHPWSGTIMRMNPDGSDLEVFARGFRNPYGLVFDPEGNLWVTDNGADDPGTSDELNLVVQGGDYGFPEVFEMPPAGSATRAPHALFGVHNSTNGVAYYGSSQFPQQYRGGLFVAMWGSSFDDAVGRAVGFVSLERSGEGYQATVEPFATGFNRPLDVTVGPQGDLWVADFFGKRVYRIWYEAPVEEEPTTPAEEPAEPAEPAEPTEPTQPTEPTEPAAPGSDGPAAPAEPGVQAIPWTWLPVVGGVLLGALVVWRVRRSR